MTAKHKKISNLDEATTFTNEMLDYFVCGNDRPVWFTYGFHEPKRNTEQNALLWKWYDLIRDHIYESTGDMFLTDDLHEYFCEMFLPSRLVNIRGLQVKTRTSTSKLSKKDFSEYLKQIEYYCASELDLNLPETIC